MIFQFLYISLGIKTLSLIKIISKILSNTKQSPSTSCFLWIINFITSSLVLTLNKNYYKTFLYIKKRFFPYFIRKKSVFLGRGWENRTPNSGFGDLTQYTIDPPINFSTFYNYIIMNLIYINYTFSIK